MSYQLVDRNGMKYTGLTPVADTQEVKLYIWKQGRHWRYVVWQMECGSVDLTGPQMQTKRDAMDRAEYVATRLWDMPVSAMTI